MFPGLHGIGSQLASNYGAWGQRRKAELSADPQLSREAVSEECGKVDARVKKLRDQLSSVEDLNSGGCDAVSRLPSFSAIESSASSRSKEQISGASGEDSAGLEALSRTAKAAEVATDVLFPVNSTSAAAKSTRVSSAASSTHGQQLRLSAPNQPHLAPPATASVRSNKGHTHQHEVVDEHVAHDHTLGTDSAAAAAATAAIDLSESKMALVPAPVGPSGGPVGAELVDSWDLDVLAYSSSELSEVRAMSDVA